MLPMMLNASITNLSLRRVRSLYMKPMNRYFVSSSFFEFFLLIRTRPRSVIGRFEARNLLSQARTDPREGPTTSLNYVLFSRIVEECD